MDTSFLNTIRYESGVSLEDPPIRVEVSVDCPLKYLLGRTFDTVEFTMIVF